jgi:hypothetical protein
VESQEEQPMIKASKTKALIRKATRKQIRRRYYLLIRNSLNSN